MKKPLVLIIYSFFYKYSEEIKAAELDHRLQIFFPPCTYWVYMRWVLVLNCVLIYFLDFILY